MRSAAILGLLTCCVVGPLCGAEAEADLWLRCEGVLAGRCAPAHLELALRRRDGALDAIVWGHAVGLNQGAHRGTVTADATTASCTIDLAGTPYAPERRAQCRLVLTPSPAVPGALNGTWSGEVDGVAVQGVWRGEERQPSPAGASGQALAQLVRLALPGAATLLAIWLKVSTALAEIVVGTVAQAVVAFLIAPAGLGALVAARLAGLPAGAAERHGDRPRRPLSGPRTAAHGGGRWGRGTWLRRRPAPRRPRAAPGRRRVSSC